MVQNVKDEYLISFKTFELQVSITQQVRDMIIANIIRENQE